MCCPTAQHVHSRMGCQCPVFDLYPNQDYTVLEILSLCVACGGQMSRMFLAGDTAQQCIAGMRYPSGTGVRCRWLQVHSAASLTLAHAGADFRFPEVRKIAKYLGQTIKKPARLHLNFRYSEHIRRLAQVPILSSIHHPLHHPSLCASLHLHTCLLRTVGL